MVNSAFRCPTVLKTFVGDLPDARYRAGLFWNPRTRKLLLPQLSVSEAVEHALPFALLSPGTVFALVNGHLSAFLTRVLKFVQLKRSSEASCCSLGIVSPGKFLCGAGYRACRVCVCVVITQQACGGWRIV